MCLCKSPCPSAAPASGRLCVAGRPARRRAGCSHGAPAPARARSAPHHPARRRPCLGARSRGAATPGACQCDALASAPRHGCRWCRRRHRRRRRPRHAGCPRRRTSRNECTAFGRRAWRCWRTAGTWSRRCVARLWPAQCAAPTCSVVVVNAARLVPGASRRVLPQEDREATREQFVEKFGPDVRREDLTIMVSKMVRRRRHAAMLHPRVPAPTGPRSAGLLGA